MLSEAPKLTDQIVGLENVEGKGGGAGRGQRFGGRKEKRRESEEDYDIRVGGEMGGKGERVRVWRATHGAMEREEPRYTR